MLVVAVLAAALLAPSATAQGPVIANGGGIGAAAVAAAAE
jgi:hypothetical protein